MDELTTGLRYENANTFRSKEDNMLNLKLGCKNIRVEYNTILYKIFKDNYRTPDVPVVLAKVNGEYLELTNPLKQSGNFEVVDISDKLGNKTYVRTLQFVLIKAAYDLFPEAKVTIEHSLSKGIFGEIHKNTPLLKKHTRYKEKNAGNNKTGYTHKENKRQQGKGYRAF